MKRKLTTTVVFNLNNFNDFFSFIHRHTGIASKDCHGAIGNGFVDAFRNSFANDDTDDHLFLNVNLGNEEQKAAMENNSDVVGEPYVNSHDKTNYVQPESSLNMDLDDCDDDLFLKIQF